MKHLIYFISLFILLINLSADEPIILKNQPVELSDGIILKADVYLPDSTNSYPVILMRTPYGKFQREKDGRMWAGKNYVAVIQDTRGKWESEGEFYPFFNELNDGLETIDWIEDQEWCNGEIGMFGTSYSGFSALVLAAHGHPALKSIFILSGWLNESDIIRPGGANHHMLNLAWMLHEFTQTKRSLKEYNFDELFSYLPIKDVFESIGITETPWDTRALLKELNKLKNLSAAEMSIPVFTMSGWYDFVLNASLNVYNELRNNHPQNKLLVGPWGHDQAINDQYQVGDVNFEQTAKMGRSKLNNLITDWFDFTIKKKQNSLENMADAELFLMGENKWEEFDEFPSPELTQKTFYVSSAGNANTSNGDGRLIKSKSTNEMSDQFMFDPNNPVPTYGGANFHFFPHLLGIRDQSEIENRADVLVYTSDKLKDDLTILGEIKVELFASTEGKDTDFTAKLVEVNKDGYAGIITEGIVRLSRRNKVNQKEKIISGKIYKAEIDLGFTGVTIKKGNRIRLEISSSNFPKYDRNPNTGEDAYEATKLVPVNQTIYHGSKYASKLKLTILDEK